MMFKETNLTSAIIEDIEKQKQNSYYNLCLLSDVFDVCKQFS